MEFEVTIRNHKDGPITVQVNSPLAAIGNAFFHLQVHQDGGVRPQFNVPVAKDGKALLKYRIRAHW